jgi:hypothetical protein
MPFIAYTYVYNVFDDDENPGRELRNFTSTDAPPPPNLCLMPKFTVLTII